MSRKVFAKRILLVLIMIAIIVNFIFPNYLLLASTAVSTTQNVASADDIEGIPDYDPGGTVSEDDLTGIINSVLGSTSEEDNTNDEGGVLFTPISQFILGIADGVISTLQATFVGDERLSNIISAEAIKETAPGNGSGKGVTNYRIKFSPAVIFSGNVATFDVNFFDPSGDADGQTEYYKTVTDYIRVDSSITYEECIRSYGARGTLQSIRDNMSMTELIAHGIAITCVINAVEALANTDWDYATVGGGASVVGIGGDAIVSIPMPSDVGLVSIAAFLAAAGISEGIAVADALKDKHLYYLQWQYDGETYYYICDSEAWQDQAERAQLNGTLYKLGETRTADVYKKTSTAYTLRPVIARWYVALRNFALVGLLTVLLYIGIRILVSTTAQDKSKYKKMLLDWLVAILILFVLHFLMVFIMYITQQLTDIFVVNNIEADGTDRFISNIRNMATGNNNESYFNYFGYVIMYITLVILTVVFTIQYLKRLVFIAFLTLVAPLIALTYPIDRLKDGQAQAFSMWIREYIFNCLLQPVHLLLYTIFIGSATGLVDANPVYAIIVLAFFTPAEKFFRRMFGFEKASSIGPLGAASAGALMMNTLNKMQGKVGKGGHSSGKDNGSKVRTVDNNIRNSSGTDQGMTNDGSAPSVDPVGGGNSGVSGTGSSTGSGSEGSSLSGSTGTASTASTGGGTASSSSTTRPRTSNGAMSNRRRMAIAGVDKLKSTGRWMANKSIRAAGAFGGATIGLAAGVASGSLGDAVRNTAAGALAGSNIAAGIGDRAQELAGGLSDRAQQFAVDHFTGNDDIDEETAEGGFADDFQDARREFINNGITDEGIISKAIEHGITGNEYRQYQESGIDDVNKITELKSEGISGEECRSYGNAGISDVDVMKNLQQSGITGIDYKAYKNVGVSTSKEMSTLKKENITPGDVADLKDIGQTDMKKVISAKQKHPDFSNEKVKDMFKLAKKSPRKLSEFKEAFAGTTRMASHIQFSDEDIERLFADLQDFF